MDLRDERETEMKVRILPNALLFDGVIDESVVFADFEIPIKKLRESVAPSEPIGVDFSKVPYANSAGIVVWLKVVYGSDTRFKYINAPVWLVNQFNMIKGYFENGSYVESLQAPFFAPKTQDSVTFTLALGKDLPILKDYSKYAVPERSDEGKTFEIDFVPEQFFSFIVENYEIFRKNVKV